MAFRTLTYNRRRTGPPNRAETLRSTTIREFGGGWNVIDNDLNLSSRFAKTFQNVFRSADGSVRVRYGTKLFSEVGNGSPIINCEYFSEHIICVLENGRIHAVDGTGASFVIWSPFVASQLPGSPAGWSSGLTFASFAQFRGELVICNGVDKPLRVFPNLVVEYLSDKSTGTNVNTPIGKYVATADRYTIIAGIKDNKSLLSISNTDTNGTFLNDPAPNDAVEFDTGQFVIQGSTVIKGIKSFRDRLIVSFEDVVMVISLGIFDGSGNHTPEVDDVIPQHGTVSHRAIQDLGDDMYFCDIRGVPSVRRTTFTERLRPRRVSELIDPAIQESLSGLTVEALEDRVFSLYHRKEGQYMLFIPDNSRDMDITETRGFVFTQIEELDVRAWSEIKGWNWRSGCISSQGRVFFTQENKVFLYGDNENPISRDFVLEQETWQDGTVFSDGTGWLVGRTEDEDSTLKDTSGIPIQFDWTLPWADFERRSNVKQLRYVNLDASGRGEFVMQVFVDNIFEARNQLGQEFNDGSTFSDGYGFDGAEPIRDPSLEMEFRGGDASGFGLQPFGSSPFGGGRLTQNEQLYAMTTRGKIFKLRMAGETLDPLQFISITLDYQLGSIRR